MYNYEDYQKWLDSLKVGDVVCYNALNFGRKFIVARVEKITPTRRFVIGGLKFNNNGSHRLSDYHSYSIEPYTDKIKNEEEYRKIYQIVVNKTHDMSKLSFMQLKAIKEILEDES